jgi:hypothetical protein
MPAVARSTVGTDQISRQPQGERDEGAEDEEVIQREAPDLQVLQRSHLHHEGDRLDTACASLDQVGLILGGQVEQHRSDCERHRPDLGHALPAHRHHHQRRQQLGHSRTDVAGTHDAQCCSLTFLGKPLRHVSDYHREAAAGDTDSECRHQIHGVGMRVGQQPSGNGAG